MSTVHVHLPAGSGLGASSPPSSTSPPAGSPPPIPTRPAPVLARAPQAVVAAAHAATVAAGATASPPSSATTSPQAHSAQAPSPAAAAAAATARILSSGLPLHAAALSLPQSTLPEVLPNSPVPFHGANRHASFVLLAEFDILKGSQLKYQYPKPTNIKENLLAESMLPEGAHLRESDWTVSFLTNQMLLQAEADLRKAQQKAREKEAAAASAAAAAAAAGGTVATPSPAVVAEGSTVTHDLVAVEVETQSQGYLCMLNLVRTKKDSTVARGAVVKALALVTRHRFYQIFKPLLMLSLDQYFDAKSAQDQVRVLANLYHTINNMPLQELPQISPLQRRLTRATRLRTATNPSAAEFFNVVVKWGGGGGGGGPAAALPATAAASAQPQTPGSGATSPAASGAPSGAGVVAPAPAPAPVATLPMRIPLCMESDEVLEASLTTLVNRFQEATMDIYTALLAEKRVIFLGYQQPAAICCDCVLSACLLVSPPVVGTIHRAFPYANLTNMDFLNVPGYIAGVTNPIFEQRNTWWDLLCNITNGTVTFSPAYAEELAAGAGAGAGATGNSGGGEGRLQSVAAMLAGGSGHGHGGGGSSDKEKDKEKEKDSKEKERALSLLDAAFFSELIRGVQLKYGEEWIRCAFRDLTHHLLLLLDGQEQFVFDDHAGSWRHLHTAAHAYRLAAFARSKQGQVWRAAQRAFQRDGSALREMDSIIRHHVRTLQVLSAAGGGAARVGVASSGGSGGGGSSSSSGGSSSALLSRTPVAVSELLVLYNDLVSHVRSREEVLELLAMLPESQGGLFPVALGLLHKHARVRGAAVALLQRIDAHPEGNRCVSALNYFLLITYYRCVRSSGAHMPECSDQEDEAGGADAGHAAAASSPGATPSMSRRTVAFMEPVAAAVAPATAGAGAAPAGAGTDTPSGSVQASPVQGLLHISTHSPFGTETHLTGAGVGAAYPPYNFPRMQSLNYDTPTPAMVAKAATVPDDEAAATAAGTATPATPAASTPAESATAAVATSPTGGADSSSNSNSNSSSSAALHIQPEMSPTSNAVAFDPPSSATRLRSPTFHDDTTTAEAGSTDPAPAAASTVSPITEEA